jgi:zinc transporter 7
VLSRLGPTTKTDGLAIGASYAAQKSAPAPSLSVASLLASRGGLASLSILFHEVPHELGDFCSLLRAGYSKRQAIAAQFATAIAALVGTAVALFVTGGGGAGGGGGDALLFLTAGGFVYLAATTLLPEILDDARSTGKFRLAQIAAFVAGIGFLYAVSLLEEADPDHHHHHHHHDDHHHHHDAFHQDHPHSDRGEL